MVFTYKTLKHEFGNLPKGLLCRLQYGEWTWRGNVERKVNLRIPDYVLALTILVIQGSGGLDLDK